MPQYTPPDGTSADFELLGYTPPAGDAADFDFTGSEISTIDAEALALEAVDSEISAEVEGIGTSSVIDAEVIGIDSPTSEISAEVMGTREEPKRLGYRIIVKNAAGTVLGEVINFRAVKFGKRLNTYGEAEFDMLVTDPLASTFIQLRKNTIEIWEESNDGQELVWAGEMALLRADLQENANNWVKVKSFTWFERLYHRFTPQTVEYLEEDQGAIASDLVTTTNTDSPTGITIGTVVPTVDRDRHFYSDNIGQSIENLANVIDGFDFEVTDLKAFNADAILGTDKTDEVVYRYGHNVKNAQIIQDFTNPINRAIVLGEAIGEDELQRVERDDAGLQTEFGLREGRLQEMDVSGLSTLEDKGDAAIRKYGEALLQVEFELIKGASPSIANYTVGDAIRLIVQSGMFSIDGAFRVFEWEVTYDKDSTTKIRLTLGDFILLPGVS